MDKKREIRIRSKGIRKTLNIAEISNLIVANIRELDVYKSAEHVMLFYPLENEIDLRGLLSDGKKFYFPRVCGEDLEVCPYKLGDELSVSGFKVMEPVSAPVDKSVIDLVLVPALAVDEKFNRIGYGKGFYDRFAEGLRGRRLVVIPDELVFDDVPSDANDRKCDGIITQKKASFDRG
ncbi:MAG: 5-formyltetrahydrofolate cyclo-ligase [Cyanobacteria bacterium RUI128]|nr:5-formyltetrahydrofolate cyclo-ligase [Cyanobacteria bacterium RUI128]